MDRIRHVFDISSFPNTVLIINDRLSYGMFACCSSVTLMLVHCIVQELYRLISNRFSSEISLHRRKFDCRIRTVSIHPKRLGRWIKHDKIEHENGKKGKIIYFQTFSKENLKWFSSIIGMV